MSVAFGDEDSQKHSLKCNMLHLYDDLPDEVDNITDMFSQGIFYGRLRLNSFGFRWKEEIIKDDGTKKRVNHAVGAVGGSMIWKSAVLNGFSIGAGAYMAQSFGSLDSEEATLYKAGKGVLSRYDVLTEDVEYMAVLAQAYLQYTHQDTSFKAGRQIFESFLTRSNDTKMIPNTFEGITLHSKVIPDTSLKMAYFTKQKLRDHSDFHHLLATGELIDNQPEELFTQNDDSAMHFGLQLSKLQARGIDDNLIVIEAKNESVENLTLTMNYTAVPDLISSAMIQADYRFYMGGLSIIPGLRYMQQFDDGAGEIGGANLKSNTEGYNDPDSLDTELYAARVDIVEDAFKLRFGYTKVADKGDILAPWRGFPTAGFTRAMAQYNWYANTESYMAQLDYEFEMIPEFKIISRFVIQDFDDEKLGVQADSNVFTIDLLKGLGEGPLYLKTRYAHVMGDDNTVFGNVIKADPSYDELRLEINYLF
ncbi:MAG: OprD family outer membrane porin [Sulfurovum sp.]|nr:OprD family outer membrane porin [Sulfurovum sp.]